MKVVGVGLNKTGTTTLGTCMRGFGFKHASWDREAFGMWLRGDIAPLLDTVAQFDSFEDFPWLLLYREIDAQHPGSKFILTQRKDAETWYRSICRHAEWTGPHEVNKEVYGYELPYGYQAEHVAYYHNHLLQIREYFAGRRDDLLEVCWEDGDGWSELAQFLQRPHPNLPFPHANKSPSWLGKMSFQAERWLKKMKRRLVSLASPQR